MLVKSSKIPVITLCFQSSLLPFMHGLSIMSEFRGKIIDAETKEPIEGAVVVAIYSKNPSG